MTPRLPPELLNHILSLAQQGEHPLERRAIRWSFKHVCKDWYLAQDELQEVCIQGIHQVEKMTRVLSSESSGGAPLSSRVKSIYFGMFKREGTNKVAKVSSLVNLITEVERIEFEVGSQGLGGNYLIGRLVVEALAELEHVKHFAITRSTEHSRPSTQEIPSSQLHKFLSGWTGLESLVIQAKSNQDCPPNSCLLAAQTNLTHVHVESPYLLQNLPPTVKSVALTNYAVTNHEAGRAPHNPAAELLAALSPTAPQLTDLSLEGSVVNWYRHRFTNPRGFHDQLLARLRDVRCLTLPAFAASNLATALGPLARLQEVRITAAGDKPAAARAVKAEEVSELLLNAPVLERLDIHEVMPHWMADERRAIGEAAEQRGIELVGVDASSGSTV